MAAVSDIQRMELEKHKIERARLSMEMNALLAQKKQEADNKREALKIFLQFNVPEEKWIKYFEFVSPSLELVKLSESKPPPPPPPSFQFPSRPMQETKDVQPSPTITKLKPAMIALHNWTHIKRHMHELGPIEEISLKTLSGEKKNIDAKKLVNDTDTMFDVLSVVPLPYSKAVMKRKLLGVLITSKRYKNVNKGKKNRSVSVPALWKGVFYLDMTQEDTDIDTDSDESESESDSDSVNSEDTDIAERERLQFMHRIRLNKRRVPNGWQFSLQKRKLPGGATLFRRNVRSKPTE